MIAFILNYYLEAILAFTLVLLSLLFKEIKVLLKDFKLLKKSMCDYSGNSLLKSCEDYKERGYCPRHIKLRLNIQYSSYHDLGGDGLITDLINQVNKLPTTKQNSTKKTKLG